MTKPMCPRCHSNTQVWDEYRSMTKHPEPGYHYWVCHRVGCYRQPIVDWPQSRNTTQGELIRMHQEAEEQVKTPPKHYDLGGGRDIHDIERAIWGDEAHAKHLLMAAFEYIARAHKKGSNTEDISKAINCLEKAKRIITESGK